MEATPVDPVDAEETDSKDPRTPRERVAEILLDATAEDRRDVRQFLLQDATEAELREVKQQVVAVLDQTDEDRRTAISTQLEAAAAVVQDLLAQLAAAAGPALEVLVRASQVRVRPQS